MELVYLLSIVWNHSESERATLDQVDLLGGQQFEYLEAPSVSASRDFHISKERCLDSSMFKGLDRDFDSVIKRPLLWWVGRPLP